MSNVFFYTIIMNLLNVILGKCEVAIDVAICVVLCFEVLLRMTSCL